MAVDGLQRFVEVFVQRCALADVGKQLAGQDEKSFCFDQVCPSLLRISVRQGGVVECGVTGLALALVDVVGEVLGNVAVKQHSQNVLLEVPAVHAAPQVVGDAPYGAVKLLALLLFSVIRHGMPLLVISTNKFLISF